MSCQLIIHLYYNGLMIFNVVFEVTEHLANICEHTQIKKRTLTCSLGESYRKSILGQGSVIYLLR